MSTLLSHVPEQPAVMRLGLTLLHFLWQGTLVALLAAVARRQLHALAAPASLRRWMAITFLAVAAACPVVTFIVLPPGASETPHHASAQLGVSKAAESSIPVPMTTVAGQDAMPDFPSSSGTIIPNAMPDPGSVDAEKISLGNTVRTAAMKDGPFGKPDNHLDAKLIYLRALLPWVVLGWALGVTLLAVRHAGGWWLMRRWRRETLPAPQE